MDFALPRHIADLVERARLVAREVLAPRANELDLAGADADEQLRALHRADLLGLLIEESEGGLGTDPLAFVLVIRALASGCPSTALCACLHASSAASMLVAARPDQRRRIVERILTDGAICAVAVSEPRTGANPSAPETLATRAGGDYVLNGTKSFVTNARWATFVTVVARHDDLDGVSTFLVEPQQSPGFLVCHDWHGFGMRATGSDRVELRDCPVPADAILGEPGKSAQATRSRGPVIPLGQAAVSLGTADNARLRLDALGLTADVGCRGAAVLEIDARIRAAGALLERAAWLAGDHPAEAGRAVSEAKLGCDTTAIRVADLADSIARAHGSVGDPTLDRCRRDARAGAVMTMNAEVCRDNIGKTLLGMGK